MKSNIMIVRLLTPFLEFLRTWTTTNDMAIMTGLFCWKGTCDLLLHNLMYFLKIKWMKGSRQTAKGVDGRLNIFLQNNPQKTRSVCLDRNKIWLFRPAKSYLECTKYLDQTTSKKQWAANTTMKALADGSLLINISINLIDLFGTSCIKLFDPE